MVVSLSYPYMMQLSLFIRSFILSLCASVYMCFVVTCWERADLLALVRGVYCEFPIGILGQVWYLIVSIPDLCTLTYFYLHLITLLCKFCCEVSGAYLLTLCIFSLLVQMQFSIDADYTLLRLGKHFVCL